MSVVDNGGPVEELVAHAFFAHRPRLYACALRVLGNREDAEEIVQDAIIRACASWRKMTPQRHSEMRLKSWLFTITLNLARSQIRKRKRRAALLSQDDAHFLGIGESVENASSPPAMVERDIEVTLVRDAINRLPPRLREPTWLHYVEDLSYPEIARILAQPNGTVKSKVFRARALLRQTLAPHRGLVH